MKKKWKLIIGVFLIVILILVGVLLYSKFYSKKESVSFKIDAIFLKSVIKQGEVITNNFKITNLQEKQNFKIYVNTLENFVSLSEKEFILQQGETKNIEAVFKGFSYPPDVYVGSIIIEADSEEKIIPTILEIQSQETLFATNLNVPVSSKQTTPGGHESVDIKIYNLIDTKPHTVKLSYSIKNFLGENVFSETENIVVTTENLITKTIIIPEDLTLGSYAFTITTRFEDSLSTSSYLFSVVEKESFFSSIGIDNFAFIFSVVVLLFLFGIVLLFVYLLHERDKLYLALRRQQDSQLKEALEQIQRRKIVTISRVKPAEKKKIEKKFIEVRKKAKKSLRERHKKQRVVFKKLKRKKRVSEMKRKLLSWKKEGFNVDEFLIETGKIKEVKKEPDIKKLKKAGYDTSALQ